MIHCNLRLLTAALGAAVLISSVQMAGAQSGPTKPPDVTDRQQDEFAEADRVLNGPAGNPECVWLGRRVVGLIWRDDLDTAFRHLELYDRFGCPANHVQSTFRCVLRQGPLDAKNPESLTSRVHACWIVPAPASVTPAPAARSGKR